MLRHANGEEVCTVDVHPLKLSRLINGILNSLEVFCETSGSNKIVNFTMFSLKFSNRSGNGFGRGDISVVCRDLGYP